ncbi:MAG: hypothetical protein WBA39_23000 [Rivularia sp. (in: cyanobacteria)]
MIIDNRFIIMQQQETLAQLICRTVLEFEQRQASLQQDKLRENTSVSATNDTSKRTISKHKSA